MGLNLAPNMTLDLELERYQRISGFDLGESTDHPIYRARKLYRANPPGCAYRTSISIRICFSSSVCFPGILMIRHRPVTLSRNKKIIGPIPISDEGSGREE